MTDTQAALFDEKLPPASVQNSLSEPQNVSIRMLSGSASTLFVPQRVRKLNPGLRGQVICLAGPPGTGKTSIGFAIAEATGRKFARVSLGGMRDEADVLRRPAGNSRPRGV